MIQGEYAIFLDDDDTFDADHIENLVKVMRQNENMLAAYSGIRVGEGINKPPFNKPYNSALLRRMNFIPFHAVLFSSKLIEDGCAFDESLEVYEDWDFWLQIAQRTEFYHFNKITATYNINGQSGAGGAGGQSVKEKDLQFWHMKVYEKWKNIWSAKQIHQTFHALATLNSGQANDVKKKMQDIQKEVQNVREEMSGHIAKRDTTIRDLQKKLEQQKKNNGYLTRHIDQLLEERIREHDEGDPSKRDFELVSTRNHEAQCMELFEEVFKEKMTKEFWNWKYAPHGMKWRGICAVKEGKVVGHYNGVARPILYFGQWKLAVQPCDIMTSSNYRGGIKINSPFYTMTETFFQTNVGMKKPFLLSFGFPNRRHMTLSERLGLYSEVDTITEAIWEKTDQIKLSDIQIEEYTENNYPADEVQELWLQMASEFNDALIGIRNKEYILQRYMKL